MLNERIIEEIFIEKLSSELKYCRRDDIRDRHALEQNFRQKFESLNNVKLTDSEFHRLLEEIIDPDVFKCAARLREINTFIRDDGSSLQYQLVNLKQWCKNSFEVVRQLRINTHSSYQRYDVILLINGLPLVHIELKNAHLSPRLAVKQILDYKRDHDNGFTNTLLCFIQLFIVSNLTQTRYFANNNEEHLRFEAEEKDLPVYCWADPDNSKISHLHDFAEKFLAKCTLAEMISRYMVLVQTERKLLIMRPYQIYAVKAIVDCIQQNRGNGYVWHTTGSGKTLTSFKTATLLKELPDVEKVLFVVDRKDLDRQTREEFNRFQPKCVEEISNTKTLVSRLLSTNYADKVIVTTIQKLGLALDPNNSKNYAKHLETLRDQRIVFIFDECHRSQFGENHKAIRQFFPKAQLFGFTGTPIFEKNALYRTIDGQEARLITTADVFDKMLHSYTITNAIEDGNVLRFHIDFYQPKSQITQDQKKRKRKIIKSILEKHDAATNQRRFNALFAVESIDDAIEYYNLFKEIQTREAINNPDFRPLNVACIFTPPADVNRDVAQLQEDLLQEKFDNKQNPEEKKAALKKIINDYNQRFQTNFALEDFDLYYQDLQQRIKSQKFPNDVLPQTKKIDLTIVVDMLLTGFNSEYLNTLYVDKPLKTHSLIQAFSRTNRVLNSTKPYGNIIDFRNGKETVDEAITLFSGVSTEQARKIWLVEPAPQVIKKLAEAVKELKIFLESKKLDFAPKDIVNLKGDTARRNFIDLFKEVRRLRTQLDQYTDLDEKHRDEIEKILPTDTLRAFQGAYLEVTAQMKKDQNTHADLNSPVEDVDFEFVLFDTALIDYDYIMKLIARFSAKKPKKQRVSREDLIELLSSNAKFLDEREELIGYVNTLKEGEGLSEQEIRAGYARFKAQRYAQRLAEIAAKHGLAPEKLQNFIDNILSRMIFDPDALTQLIEPLGLNWKARAQKELALMKDLTPLLRKLAQGQKISGLEVYDYA